MKFLLRDYLQTYLAEDVIKAPGVAHGQTGQFEHVRNLLDCARSPGQVVAHSKVARRSWGLVHNGGIANSAGRVLRCDLTSEVFVNDLEANMPRTK